jgi:hypothetical protein
MQNKKWQNLTALSRLSLALCALAFLPVVSASAQTFSCASGYTDVAQYMMGSYFVNNPNADYYMEADPEYKDNSMSGNTSQYPQWWPQTSTAPGKLWWSRLYNSSYEGYNWDMSQFDDANIYFGFTNPNPNATDNNEYRQYYDPQNTASGAYYWTVAPRCVLTSTPAGSLYSNGESVIPPEYGITTQDTDFYNVNPSACDPGPIEPNTTGVTGAVFELYAPESQTSKLPEPLNLPSNPDDNLMALVYRWDYDASTEVYQVRETFYYDSQYGWVAWTSENWNGSEYVFQQFNYADTFTSIAQHVAPWQPTDLVGSSSCPTS